MSSSPPPPIRSTDLAEPDTIERWAVAFDEAGGGTVEEFADWLKLNAKCGDGERRYAGRQTLGLET